jgi:hypothetical protein
LPVSEGKVGWEVDLELTEGSNTGRLPITEMGTEIYPEVFGIMDPATPAYLYVIEVGPFMKVGCSITVRRRIRAQMEYCARYVWTPFGFGAALKNVGHPVKLWGVCKVTRRFESIFHRRYRKAQLAPLGQMEDVAKASEWYPSEGPQRKVLMRLKWTPFPEQYHSNSWLVGDFRFGGKRTKV